MKGVPKRILDLPMEQRALMALRAAARKAYAEHSRLGIPFYVLQDGKVVDLLATEGRRQKNAEGRRLARPRKSR
jgi:hypothetical protein